MQSKIDQKKRNKRKELFRDVIGAFEDKYSWLGHIAAKEMLMSAASMNIEKHSDPPMRFRNHLMFAWNRGWLKSSMLGKMAKILGDDLCSVMGKVTDAGMRGSVSSGQFTPPKPLKTPIVISTEFGQTDFEDELLNLFLSLLEEGYTNVTMNKIGQLPETQKREIERRFDGQIQFGESNEFNLNTDFVFWGATYDPSKLQDDALKSRLNVVTPPKPLGGELTKQIDRGSFNLSQKTIREVRRELKTEEESPTTFTPPAKLYKKYNMIPRESRDLQAYMAAMNWWGLDTGPDVMENYIKELKKSRRKASMDRYDRVLDLILDNPMSQNEIVRRTGFDRVEVHKLIQNLDATRVPTSNGEPDLWAVYGSADSLDSNSTQDDEQSEESSGGGFLDDLATDGKGN